MHNCHIQITQKDASSGEKGISFVFLRFCASALDLKPSLSNHYCNKTDKNLFKIIFGNQYSNFDCKSSVNPKPAQGKYSESK